LYSDVKLSDKHNFYSQPTLDAWKLAQSRIDEAFFGQVVLMNCSVVALIFTEVYYMLNPDPLTLPLLLNAAFFAYLVLVIGSSMMWSHWSFCNVKRTHWVV
jgi:hypothetical protein